MEKFNDIEDFENLNSKFSDIGRGSQGKVQLMQSKITGLLYAVKIINKERLRDAQIKILNREIYIHKLLNHDNIIKYYGYIESEKEIFIFLEYAENNSLFNYINLNQKLFSNIKNCDIHLKIFYGVCKGIRHLHNNCIVHRDLKPENILLTGDLTPKICDFGWAAELFENQKRDTLCGTFEYMPPEIVFGIQQSTKTDIWCLGILLYEMIHGFAPFKVKCLDDLINTYKTERINIKFRKDINPSHKELILKMLKINQIKRPSITDILNDNIFSKYNNNNLIKVRIIKERVYDNNIYNKNKLPVYYNLLKTNYL